MHAWEAIQKSLDYIETNISDEINIEQLAKGSSLSLFYYQRLFSRLVKKPVREYIKLRRLSRALESLADKQRRILDVALDYGFGSHETFTRAFKEAYKITPEEYRKHPVMLNQFDKPDLLLTYMMIDEGVPLISDGLVLEFNRKTILQPILFMGVSGIIPIEGQMPLGESTGVDMPGEVWENSTKKNSLFLESMEGSNWELLILVMCRKGILLTLPVHKCRKEQKMPVLLVGNFRQENILSVDLKRRILDNL